MPLKSKTAIQYNKLSKISKINLPEETKYKIYAE